MGVFAGPDVSESGLVLALDAANIKGYDKYENLLTQSNTDVEFSNGAAPNTWTSGYLAPDNSLTAKLCTTNNRSFKEYVSSSVNNVVSTFSIYLKSTGSSLSRTFDLRDIATDTVRTTKSIVITGEWQRFDITGTVQANGVRIEITGGIQNIYAWGAQLERGSTANDYYSTTGTVKTRGTTWTDLSGRGNTGTLVNTPTYNSSGYFNFDYTQSESVSFSSSSSLQFLNTSPYTLEAWVYPTRNPGASNFTGIFDREDSSIGSRDGYNIFFLGSATTNTFFITERFVAGVNNSTSVTLDQSVSVNNWSHIVATYNGTTLTLYRNGSSVGTPATTTGNITNTSKTLTVGVRGGNYFGGRIANTKIYNRALTASEIRQNYLATKSRYGL